MTLRKLGKNQVIKHTKDDAGLMCLIITKLQDNNNTSQVYL